MRFTPATSRNRSSFDMTPMIDIVLQLIIFFMVTSQFSKMIRSDIDLPQEEGRTETEHDPRQIVIDVDEHGTMLAESQPIDRQRLVQMINAAARSAGDDPALVRVLVRADREAPTRAVNRIARDLAVLGVGSWRVGTERPRGGTGGGG